MIDLADVSHDIAAPAAAVWRVVTDFAHPQRLAPTIDRVEMREAGVGAVRIVHSSRGLVIHEELLEADRAALRFRYAVRDSGDMPFAGVGSYRATVELTALSPATTRVRWRSEGEVDGPVEPIRDFLAGLYRTAIKRIAALVTPPAIDLVLTGAVAAGVAPGFVAIIADAGGTLYAGAHGVTTAGGDEPMRLDTGFWIASMTKLVTTVAAMQLVEAGRLDLDAPVAGLLPELAAPMVLESDGALRPARGAITLRHLLTHRSGLGYDLMNPVLLAARGPAGPPRATALASLDLPLLFDPGEGWEYGVGIDWAGIAVERVTGTRLDDYFAAHIFAPLGMIATGFDVVPDAAMHLRLTDGLKPIPSLTGSAADREYLSGGGGLSGTAVNFVRLLRMLLGGGMLDGVRLLSAATVAAMGLDASGGYAAGRVGSASEFFVPFDPLPGQRGGWSLLGVRNPAGLPGRRAAGSAGWVGAGGTFFWLDPEGDLCGVLLAQLLPFGDPALSRTFAAFEAAAYAAFGSPAHVCNSASPGPDARVGAAAVD